MNERVEIIQEYVLACLERMRREQKLTLRELAKRAGIDRSYVGLLEKRKRRPSLEVAIRLSEALGMSLSELLSQAEKACGQKKRKIKS